MHDLFTDPQGPIEHFSWGRYVIAGQEHAQSEDGETGMGKDIRLIGREVSRWEERKGHRLKKSMITGVYGKGLEVLIIGNGVHGALECPDKVREDIAAHGIPRLMVARTPEACRLYNQLYRQGVRVGLLAHGTC
jgi:hypothetical protein